MMSREIWKPIPEYPNYEVSNLGRVRSLKRNTPHILRPSFDKKGYPGVGLYINGIGTFRKIHTLVAITFIGPRPDGMEICHNDSNPQNNRVDNLRYDTRVMNSQDAIIQGSLKGLTLQQRKQVKQKRLNGVLVKTIAQEYGVHEQTVLRTSRKIALRPYEFENRRAKGIREEYAKGNTSYSKLAQKYDLDRSSISLIVNGKRCPEAGGPIKDIDY